MKAIILIIWTAMFATAGFSQIKQSTDSSAVKDTVKRDVLREVVIKARRPLLVHEIDKVVVNVESMIGSTTNNVLGVLEGTPGVTVSPSGEISLNGKGGVLVMIDGRQTFMSGPDLASYLKSLPGAMVDKLELMDNPPAKYDAAGSSIINIRLKKNRTAGFTGSVSSGYSQGVYARTNNAVNVNYNNRKVNVFANIGFNAEKTYTSDLYDRKFYAENGNLTSSIDIFNNNLLASRSVNLNAGIDYAANANNTYGLIVNRNKGHRDGKLDYYNNAFTADHQLSGKGDGNTVADDDRDIYGLNLNMLHKFGNSGRELTADINYLKYRSTSVQNLANYFYEPEGTLMQTSDFLYFLPADAEIYSAKADYTHPLKNQTRVDAGFKSSIIDNDNIADFYDVEGGIKTIDNDKSNHFIYHENINALYINSQKTVKRFSIQLGMRAENTYARGRQLGNDSIAGSSFSKSYTGLFPAAYLNYKLDTLGKNSFNLSFTRRINRPNYQLLNPFIFFRDQYSYTSGNSSLGPQYQQRIELKYQHRQLLNMGLSYNRFTHVIFQTTQAVDNIFITKPDNIASGFMLLLNTSVSYSPAKWWNCNTTLRLSHMGINGKVYTEKLNPRMNVARLEVNNYFTFGRNWNAEAGGYYASSDLNGQSKTSGIYRLNAGIQKKILKEKGTLRLNFEDIFHSWVYHNRSISVKQAKYFQITESDTQRIGIAFSYRFGKEKFSRKRRNSNASDEEKDRLQ